MRTLSAIAATAVFILETGVAHEPSTLLAESAALTIWGGGDIPKSADIPLVRDVRFHVIKLNRPGNAGGSRI